MFPFAKIESINLNMVTYAYHPMLMICLCMAISSFIRTKKDIEILVFIGYGVLHEFVFRKFSFLFPYLILLSNLYFIVLSICWTRFIIKNMEVFQKSKFLYFLISLFLISILWAILSEGIFGSYNKLLSAATSIYISFLGLIFLMDIMNRNQIFKLSTYYPFWFVTGILGWCIFDIVRFSGFNITYREDPVLFHYVFFMFTCVNIVFYLTLMNGYHIHLKSLK